MLWQILRKRLLPASAGIVLPAAVAVAGLLITGCGQPSAQPATRVTPSVNPMQVVGHGTLIGPIASSKTLLDAVSNRLLVERSYEGRVAAVRSYVTADDEIYSDVQLVQPNGTSAPFTMYGGTVPGRELKAIASPAVGTAAAAALQRPVTMSMEGGVLVPAVGQDVVAFVKRAEGRALPLAQVILVVGTSDGSRSITFSGLPSGTKMYGLWNPPASDAELKALISAAS